MTAVVDPRLSFIFGNAANSDALAVLMTQLFGLEEGAPPMTVLQLRHLTSGLDQLVVAVVCRLARALTEWSANPPKLLLLIEDAERFAPAAPIDTASELSTRAIRELSDRARKLGIAIGFTAACPRLVQQQLMLGVGMAFVHRLPSSLDVDLIEDLVPEAVPAILGGVGTLAPGEAIGVGRGFNCPGRFTVTELPETAIPSARPAVLPLGDEDPLQQTINRWRNCG